MKQSRREFIKTTSVVSAGAVISPNLFGNTMSSQKNPICVFTKCLQFLDYVKLGEALLEVGFKGADLPVRKGGHVLPENVKTDLPKAIKILKQSGVSVPMIVTGIVNPDDPMTETILGTAADQGVGFYRMGYFGYNPSKSITDNLISHKKTFDKLEKLNKKFSIVGCYQNHSGTNVGGPVWDLHSLVNGCDPKFIGVQYDIHHAVVEGGTSWPLGIDLLAPWIRTIAIKDFLWNEVNGKWVIKNVPLGDGMVDFDSYFKKYKSLGISAPVTIHYEYDLGGAEHGNKTTTMSLKEILRYLKTDRDWLRNKFIEHSISGFD
jgi:L-ribulose-5-phosphate 3-epimerase